MTSDALFSREEVLAGAAPTKRAQTLLFLIESRTAHIVARSRQAMERFASEETARERDLAFLEAFAAGRDLPLRPTIQDLERHAARWAGLVPDNPRLRAAVAHLLGEKYRFTARATPHLRAALGLDEAAVGQAYERLFQQPLASIYAPRPTLLERLRWGRAEAARRLESLPPFWTAFSLTLTETVGIGILALPVAVAGLGPLPALALLVVLGLVNLLTIVGLAEAVARTASVRYGDAYFRRLVAEYLGRPGSILLSAALVGVCIILLLSAYIGLSLTLTDITGVPQAAWIAGLYALGLYFLSRGSLSSTVASALAVGAVNLVMILALVLLAVPHIDRDNLAYAEVPGLRGRPFDSAVLGVVFGVILTAYFGHMSVGNCGKIVLRRDPSSRSLVWGAAAAQVAAMGLYCVWTLAINGAIASEILEGFGGTALDPLEAEIGPIVHVFGSVFVILGMGMGSIHGALGLFNAAKEWLPNRSRSEVALPRRRGRLRFERIGEPDGARLGVTYLGLVGEQPRFRLDVEDGRRSERLELVVAGRWDSREALARLPDIDSRRLRLQLEILEAGPEAVRLRVASPLDLTYEGNLEAVGLDLLDLLGDGAADGAAERPLVQWILRRGDVSLAEVAAHLNQDEPAARARLTGLVKQGTLLTTTRNGETRYGARLARHRGRSLPDDVWAAALGEEPPSAPTRVGAPKRRGWAERLLASRRGRFVIACLPGFVIFLVAEWLAVSDAAFTAVLNFGGVTAIPIFAGLFAVLLLVTSRRRGDLVPGLVYPALGHPVVATAVYLVFLGSILAHGLVIWEEPAARVAALVVAAVAMAATVDVLRRGMLARRLVVTLREDQEQGEPAVFAVVAGGRPVAADVRLERAGGAREVHADAGEVGDLASLRSATFEVPSTGAADLRVWVQRIGPDGTAEGLPADVIVRCGEGNPPVERVVADGQALMPIGDGVCRVHVDLEDRSRA